MMCCVVRRPHVLPAISCRTCPSSAVVVHGWHVACCKLRRIPAVGALERTVTWHGYAAHVQYQGAVAFMTAGTLELDGSTIANTASTTVRTLRGCRRGLAVLRSQR